jgi:phosphoesterase RecJ-like protein
MIKVPDELLDIIDRSQKIGLITHLNGDGDAFGSLLGLRNILLSRGKEVVVFSNETLPDYMMYLKKEANYAPIENYKKVDLLIGLDSAAINRFTVPEIFIKAKENNIKTAVIDHHTEGEIHGNVNVSWRKEDVSSTAEMIYWLAEALDAKLDKITAQLLLTGLEHDTYFLTNPNVFDPTKEAQKRLWDLGGETEIIRKSVEEISPTKNSILMKRIDSRIISENGILFAYITEEDKKDAGLVGQNISSVISSYYDTLNKPKVSIAAEQRDGDSIKVSMRSNNSDVDVAQICKEFGGGGHVHAAGFEIKGKLEEVLKTNFFEDLFSKIS